jgi:phosphatidylethanolamine-binding protein (PEBP) family uncharacterized protein
MRKSYSLTTVLALALGAGGLSLSNCGGDSEGGTGGSGGSAGTGGSGGRGGSGGTGGTAGTGGSGGTGGSAGSGGSGGSGGARPVDARRDSARPADTGARLDGRGPDTGARLDGGGGDGGAAAAPTTFVLEVGDVDMRMDRRVFRNGQTNGTGNRSPSFVWGPNPEAKSYALSMVDQCNNGTHWIIYDIPATVTRLPAQLMRPTTANVPEVPGAKHTRFSGGNPFGYFGPGAGSCNRYNFIVHAMRAETLPATGDKQAIRTAVFSAANRIAATPQVQVVGNNGAGMCTGALGCGP